MEEHPQWSGAPAISDETTTTSTDTGRDTGTQQEAVDSFEVEDCENTARQVADGAHLPVNFTDFLSLKWKTYVEMENGMESDKDRSKNGGSASASAEMLSCRRENQVSNLDISLLPAGERLELLRVPQQTDEKNMLAQKRPFVGGVSPSTRANVFRSPFTESQKQPEQNQFTIFYRGTVNVYNVSPDLAKAITLLAADKKNVALRPGTPSTCQPALTPKAGVAVSKIPIARRNSLKRFMEKRKDRFLISRPPYCNTST